jgi:antitoxin PrlF
VGDVQVYEIQGDRVVLSRALPPPDGDDPFAKYSEWDSAADRKAYGRLQAGRGGDVPAET